MSHRAAVLVLFVICGCASRDQIETVPVEDVQRKYVLEAGPCEYQGTLHRSLRFDVDRELDEKQITLDQWTCLTRALTRMDARLKQACAEGEAEARRVLLLREQESKACSS